MKNNKGITLIALIITIIVMLILVGVTVAVVVNSNLIGTAQGAKANTEAHAVNDQTYGMNVTIKGEPYESVGDYVKPNGGNGGAGGDPEGGHDEICNHTYGTDGKCTNCGKECTHTYGTNGFCTVCGKEKFDKVMTITYNGNVETFEIKNTTTGNDLATLYPSDFSLDGNALKYKNMYLVASCMFVCVHDGVDGYLALEPISVISVKDKNIIEFYSGTDERFVTNLR